MSDHYWDFIHHGWQPNPAEYSNNLEGLRYQRCALCGKTPSNLRSYAITRKRGGIVCGICWLNAREACEALGD